MCCFYDMGRNRKYRGIIIMVWWYFILEMFNSIMGIVIGVYWKVCWWVCDDWIWYWEDMARIIWIKKEVEGLIEV